MKDREKEYKEIFIAETLQDYDALNRHFVELEKNPENDKILAEIFRLLHNLKANAKAMNYLIISDLAHHLENIFSEVRSGKIQFDKNTSTAVFNGIDYLGFLLGHIDDPTKQILDKELVNSLEGIVQYNGIPAGGREKNPARIYTSQNIALSELISVPVKKLDTLLNLVGELIIDRDRITSLATDIGNNELKAVSAHLERITNELQNSVMETRLVNIGYLFNKFPRIVRDIAITENKTIQLDIKGSDIKIDRNILQIITDALLHIIRNAITHGIEDAETRRKNNKAEEGLLQISAITDKENVIIEITDDGKGINTKQVKEHATKSNFISKEMAEEMNDIELLSLIFEPGFSLSKEVTHLSGRGVGLDIVKNALDSIGGKILLRSGEGKGSTFSLHLPNSIAVKGALLFEVNQNAYAIPLIHTESVITLGRKHIHEANASLFANIKGETIPLIYLTELFNSPIGKGNIEKKQEDLIIVSYNNRKLGLIVDKLLRQQDIVIKALQKPIDNIQLFDGVTLLGNGQICLVLDVPAISKQLNIRRDLDATIYK